jgi:hypothetical protein
MPIPPAQLSRWMNRGGTTASENAYAAINNALTAPNSAVRGRDYELFLQGSYRNATNIYGDSDIDVVLALNETKIDNGPYLSPNDRPLIPQGTPATYPIESFRRDVITTLRAAFATNRIREGSRAIHVDTGHGREADVVPSICYYHYYRPAFLPQLAHHLGIAFLSENQWLSNFPKQHIDNSQAKNAPLRTNGRYKPTVRMFKNARNSAVTRGFLIADAAPSYFIEGLLYNVPDQLFTSDPEETFVGVYNHLHPRQANTLTSQNGIIPLIGTAPTQWQFASVQRFMAGLRRLWDEWT